MAKVGYGYYTTAVMTGLALGLILLSAIAHAIWNLLAKRTGNQDLFIWWIIVSISFIFAPLAVFLFYTYTIAPPGWWFVLGTIILHAIYFMLLGRSYAHADFSLVYPIARGLGPALVPILGVLVLGEALTTLGVVGIILVIIGIYTVYWWGQVRQLLKDPLRFFRETGTKYAILTGLVNAVQSVWDKVGVQYVNPFFYMYLLALGGVIVLVPYMVCRYGPGTVRSEGQRNLKIIPIAGMLMFCAYGLVLLAMQFTQVSYIIPAREIGIVFGVLLGVVLLREPFGRGRIIGSCLIALGVAFISLSR